MNSLAFLYPGTLFFSIQYGKNSVKIPCER